MVKSKLTSKASVSKLKASQKPWVRKMHGPTKRGFHTQKRRVSDGSNAERPEVELKESWPRKKVKHTEVNVNDEDEDEVVEVEENEEEVEEIDDDDGEDAETESNQQVSMV
jgi:hypothetical protein